MTFGFDLNCTEVQGFTLTGTIKITGTMAINPDGTFGLNDTYSEPDYREKVEFTGKLTAPEQRERDVHARHRARRFRVRDAPLPVRLARPSPGTPR